MAKKSTVTSGGLLGGITNLSPLTPSLVGVLANSPIENQISEITKKQTADNAELNQTNMQNSEIAGLRDQLNSLMSSFNQQSQYQSEAEARINALNQAKQAQALADLGKARDTQLSNLASEESGIKPLYDTKRNSASSTNMLGRRTLAEELAARGESRSGVADEANIRANMSLQSDLGTLNAQEASNISDIARRRTGINNAYESDLASTKAGLEAATMRSLIDQYNADRQFKLSEAGVTGTYNGGQTLAAQGQTFDQNMKTKEFDSSEDQRKFENLFKQQTFDYQVSRDAVADKQWQKLLDLDLRKQSFNETQAKIENALSSRRISQEDASQALQWARFNADQDPNSLDNRYKLAQINSINGETNANAYPTVNDYATQIEAKFTQQPSSANGYKKTVNTAGVKAYLDELIKAGIPDTIIDQLASKYGIQ